MRGKNSWFLGQSLSIQLFKLNLAMEETLDSFQVYLDKGLQNE
jgi:hypothetical protein